MGGHSSPGPRGRATGTSVEKSADARRKPFELRGPPTRKIIPGVLGSSGPTRRWTSLNPSNQTTGRGRSRCRREFDRTTGNHLISLYIYYVELLGYLNMTRGFNRVKGQKKLLTPSRSLRPIDSHDLLVPLNFVYIGKHTFSNILHRIRGDVSCCINSSQTCSKLKGNYCSGINSRS